MWEPNVKWFASWTIKDDIFGLDGLGYTSDYFVVANFEVFKSLGIFIAVNALLFTLVLIAKCM